ncbi:glycoside hydrolase family 57 protein [Bryobacter aggregatus]|uniref:glycoside hydrolase family 57 protein n=1 Tax=Bryobacter aggregatus TaxID=360054 RepID=UPI00055C039F|nr:glycoside hydrolase family 57 protein [Bryobacter aggregatus]
MPKIYLSFVWHMHQPFYKDLVSNEYKLPWTRLHALKDYYGMVKVLEDFPQVHQTFNLVPSMLVQLDEYARGVAVDPFLRCANKDSASLTDGEREFILRYFFQANVQRMIYRYPRYGELYEAFLAVNENTSRALNTFNDTAFRDLQVLSQLAWFDEEFLTHDSDVKALVSKGRGYSSADQSLLAAKQLEKLGLVLDVYRDFSKRGQIEVSATPFYHPILPLICDSQIAEISHPYVALPPRFRYPQDARVQLERSRDYMQQQFGQAPKGLWPSEGSVSDEALCLAHETGFRWFATDNGVLARTIDHAGTPDVTYRPYLWKQGKYEMHGLFRDHTLSDLIGFVYSRMGAKEAADHFLAAIRANCAPILRAGRDALVPIILDGENAWEYFDLSGRPFLRELYRQIEEDPKMEALTVSEAIAKVPAEPIGHIFPASWISTNFDIWIGAEEDNKAWEYLLRARETYDKVKDHVSEEARCLAFEELLIAEGSDWNWWYGPEHSSANRTDFDRLYREHLANVYRALGLLPPEELSRPILKVDIQVTHQSPRGPLRPDIDGQISSYFEWMGSGSYSIDQRQGAMHGQRFLIQELHYGSDGAWLFIRIDFVKGMEESLRGAELRFQFQGTEVTVPLVPLYETPPHDPLLLRAAYDQIFELRISQRAVAKAHPIRFQVSVWKDGLPLDALPQQGSIELLSHELNEWLG